MRNYWGDKNEVGLVNATFNITEYSPHIDTLVSMAIPSDIVKTAYNDALELSIIDANWTTFSINPKSDPALVIELRQCTPTEFTHLRDPRYSINTRQTIACLYVNRWELHLITSNESYRIGERNHILIDRYKTTLIGTLYCDNTDIQLQAARYKLLKHE